jgi:hypothetical protein
MTNRLDPYHTGPATDPAAEPTPTELLTWLRGREAAVNDKLVALQEGLVRAIDAKLEPVTKQLSELQLQADATNRLLDQHVTGEGPATAELRRQVEDVTRHLRSHVVAEQPHSLTSYPIPRLRQVEDLVHGVRRDLDEMRRHPSNDGIFDHLKKIEASFEVVEETVRSLRQDFTHHLDLHEGLDSGEEPDVSAEGPDADRLKYADQLRTAYSFFIRIAADPGVTRERLDVAIHDFREQVFELTKWMRIAMSSQEGQGAQAS